MVRELEVAQLQVHVDQRTLARRRGEERRLELEQVEISEDDRELRANPSSSITGTRPYGLSARYSAFLWAPAAISTTTSSCSMSFSSNAMRTRRENVDSSEQCNLIMLAWPLFRHSRNPTHAEVVWWRFGRGESRLSGSARQWSRESARRQRKVAECRRAHRE